MNNEPPKPRQNPGHTMMTASPGSPPVVVTVLLFVMFVVMFAALILASR